MFNFKKKEDNLSDSERYYRAQKCDLWMTCIALIASTIATSLGLSAYENYETRKSNNKRNASYIEEADTNSKFYEWCLDATDINTLVYFENGKAYLYEFDYESIDKETGLYLAITPSGEYRYIPINNATSFEDHESAYQYAYQMLGNEDNIVCVSYPNHSKKLVP